MKRLMVAASAAALSAAVFADVYNVKFTASTLVDADGNKATRKVKGETEEYYKKNTVTVNGVYDSETGETYFWTGSGKKMAPVQSAVLEISNEQEMDELKRTDAGKAVNVGLYIGQSDNLTSYFVSGGIGKGALNSKNKESKEWTADLVSASGSFGGTWYGYPAYGSWSFSKNATATKNGIAEYVNKQGKSAGITTASWTGTSDIAAKLEKLHEAVKEADTVSAMIKQIAALTGTNIDQASTIAAQEAAIAANNAKIKEQEDAIAENKKAIAENEAIIAENEKKIAEQQGQIDSDTEALEQANAALAAANETIAAKNAELEKANADLAAKNDELEKANADLLAAAASIAEKDGEIETLKADSAKALAEAAAKAAADLEAALAAAGEEAEADKAAALAAAAAQAQADLEAALAAAAEEAEADKAAALAEAATKAAADLEAALAAAGEEAEADKAAALAAAAAQAQADLEAALAAAAEEAEADKAAALAAAAAQAQADLEAALAAAEESYADELKALDNESFVGVTETISDYLKETIEKQTALSAEAGEKLAAANDAIAAYEEAVADDFTERLVAQLAAASNAVTAAEASAESAEKAAEKADQDLDWLYNIKYDNYAYDYENRTNEIVKAAAEDKAAKQADIAEALADYKEAVAALEGDNDTLIDVTLPGETNELATATIPALEDAKAEKAAAYEDAVAAQTCADEYLAEYTTEDGKGNYAKYLADNGIADSGDARLDFLRNVYPAMQKDAADAAEATTAAKEADEAAAKNLADAEAELTAKTERLDALIAARENGNLAEELQNQLDDLTAGYEADTARLEAELAAIGTKEEEDLVAAKKAYDDSYAYEHSDKSLDEEISKAEAASEAAWEAANDAWEALWEAQQARDDVEDALADVSTIIEERAVEVEAVIGVRPDAEEGYEEAVEQFFADWSALGGTTGENVAAAKAILARLGKSVD